MERVMACDAPPKNFPKTLCAAHRASIMLLERFLLWHIARLERQTNR
jgi:hypothetical protein